MIKRLKLILIILVLILCKFSANALAEETAKEGASTCSAEQMEKIEKDLTKAAEEGMKNSKTLLNNYNSIAKQYVSECNQNLNVGTPVYWSIISISSAYAVSKDVAEKLISFDNKSDYQYTGVVWSAEEPKNKECANLKQQADIALQNFNKSRITTSALLIRAGGNDIPRACVCSENADNQECITYTTKDMVQKTTNGCKVFAEYMSEFSVCPLCPVFEVILNTNSRIAHISWTSFSKPLQGVVVAFFLVFLALETLKLVASMGGASTSSYLKSLFALSFKVAITLILLQNSTYVYNYFISPVIKGGLEMGQEFIKMNSEDSSKKCNLDGLNVSFNTIEGSELDSEILSDIYETVRCFNNSAITLPAIGKSLMCHGWENEEGWDLPDFRMWFSGAVNYIFGLMIWLAFAFFLVDCTVQLGIVCALVPLFVACWPFKMTQRYTFTGVKIIMNTFFTFALMGVVMMLGIELVAFALQGGNSNMDSAQLLATLNGIDIDAQKLRKMFDFEETSFLGLLACCIIALKLITTAKSAANKFSTVSSSGIGEKVGTLGASLGNKLASPIVGGGLTMAKGTAIAIGQKAAKTDTGRYVARKYRSGVNAVRGAFGLSQSQSGSGLPNTEAQATTPETTHSQNQNSENSQTTQNQQHNSQNQNSENSQKPNNEEKATYDNGQPKFSETTDENGNTNRKNFDKNGKVTSETKTDKNGKEVEYKGYHANGELAAHHTVDENGTRHWQTFNEDKTLNTEGSYNEKTGDRTEKKYDHGQLTSERTDSGNGDYSYKTYHSNGKTKQEGKGNINTGGHHTSYDEEQNVTRKWHTFEKGQTDE